MKFIVTFDPMATTAMLTELKINNLKQHSSKKQKKKKSKTT